MNAKAAKCIAVILLWAMLLTGCAQSEGGTASGGVVSVQASTVGRYLAIATSDTDTFDPQCTSDHYLVALNVFDRLVEVSVDREGRTKIVPSLAESWEISEDGYVYTFHLRQDVTYSNGSPLTASDVRYTMMRLLTNPDSCNQDVVSAVFGAEALREGRLQTLAGFIIHNDYEFAIVLSQPYAAFLACLSTPGASVLDQESTTMAGRLFGKTAQYTVGTGPFVMEDWKPGVEMKLKANQKCWSGPPRCGGMTVRIVSDSESQRLLFENGTLDILDLDNMGTEAEYFYHGDIYQKKLRRGSRVGINYIALNSSIQPLNDVRVRKALQLALDREMLLKAMVGGRGQVENGIFPRGLIGHNARLPEIPFDLNRARELLEEAGYPDGFDLEISVPSDALQNRTELAELAAAMWRKAGVNARVVLVDADTFMTRRRAGAVSCYINQWSADFNDPDNFIYTFFGTERNTRTRSLCYGNEAIMERVCKARGIVDENARLQEYQELERIIVQDDAAWIPLYSQQHYFVVSDRVGGFKVAWNGWSNTNYRDVVLLE